MERDGTHHSSLIKYSTLELLHVAHCSIYSHPVLPNSIYHSGRRRRSYSERTYICHHHGTYSPSTLHTTHTTLLYIVYLFIMTDNVTLAFPSVTIAPTSTPLTATTNTTTTTTTTTPMVDYHQIVFVRKSSNTNQSTTTNIPIGYYTSCPTTDDDDAINNTNIDSPSMTSQIIEFQYNITWLVVTNTAIDMNSSAISTTTNHFIDSIRFTMETTLHEYLVPELLSTCRTDQAEDDDVDVQFYSVSTFQNRYVFRQYIAPASVSKILTAKYVSTKNSYGQIRL